METELIELCENVRDGVFKALDYQEVQTKEQFDKHVDEVLRLELNDGSTHISGCQEEALLKCIGYDIGRCVEALVDNYGADIFQGLKRARINELIIQQAVECMLEDDDEITFEKYQVYCSSKTD
jgi:hypothetical protein